MFKNLSVRGLTLSEIQGFTAMQTN